MVSVCDLAYRPKFLSLGIGIVVLLVIGSPHYGPVTSVAQEQNTKPNLVLEDAILDLFKIKIDCDQSNVPQEVKEKAIGLWEKKKSLIPQMAANDANGKEPPEDQQKLVSEIFQEFKKLPSVKSLDSFLGSLEDKYIYWYKTIDKFKAHKDKFKREILAKNPQNQTLEAISEDMNNRLYEVNLAWSMCRMNVSNYGQVSKWCKSQSGQHDEKEQKMVLAAVQKVDNLIEKQMAEFKGESGSNAIAGALAGLNPIHWGPIVAVVAVLVVGVAAFVLLKKDRKPASDGAIGGLKKANTTKSSLAGTKTQGSKQSTRSSAGPSTRGGTTQSKTTSKTTV